MDLKRLGEVEEGLAGIVTALDPDVLEPRLAAELVERFARLAKLADAGKALAARRVADSGLWKAEGHRGPGEWLARRSGTTVGGAIADLEAAEAARQLEGVDAALRRGDLSADQARAIAPAAAADPQAEQALLDAAQSEPLQSLRAKARKVQEAAQSDELDRYEAARAGTFFRHFATASGRERLEAELMPDEAAVVLAAMEPHRRRIFDQARRTGRRDATHRYDAEALVAMATASVGRDGSGPKPVINLRVDMAAFERGSTEAGETCEIPGIGPVPVAVARAWADDAILRVLLVEATDVVAMVNMSRGPTLAQRIALEERDPVCVVPGCNESFGLEVDHRTPWVDVRRTELHNLNRLCRWHHYLKTHKGWRLEGGPGRWEWLPPPQRPGPDLHRLEGGAGDLDVRADDAVPGSTGRGQRAAPSREVTDAGLRTALEACQKAAQLARAGRR